jgi:hypothetical protein
VILNQISENESFGNYVFKKLRFEIVENCFFKFASKLVLFWKYRILGHVWVTLVFFIIFYSFSKTCLVFFFELKFYSCFIQLFLILSQVP